jgi:hypothetical protein
LPENTPYEPPSVEPIDTDGELLVTAAGQTTT